MYWSEVRRILASRSHFVEIDLLRGGPRMPWLDLPLCSYSLVSRSDARPRADVWPVRLRDPLPNITIPLNPGDAEPTIDLQALLHHVYDAAGYASSIYDGQPEPRLNPDDEAWAAELLGSLQR